MKISISKNLKRFCLRLVNGVLIASVFTIAGNPNFVPPAGYTQEIVTGVVNLPDLGIQLMLPHGWQGQLSDEALVLQSYNETGSIILTLNQATSVEELIQAGDAGFYEPGIQFTRSGEYQQVGYNGVGAEFTGSLQGAPAKAFIAGVINPYGQGVTIFAIANAAEYDARKPSLVQEIANNLRFSAPQEASVNERYGIDDSDVPVIIQNHDSGCSTTTIGGQSVSNC